MKKHLRTVLTMGMISLVGTAFCQTGDLSENKVSGKAATSTHLGLLLNMINTNLNYGQANRELSAYKKSNRGIQAGLTFQAGITPRLSLSSELYFLMKGGQLKENNSLTVSKTSLRFYSLELPVLARFHFGGFYVNAGPYLGYNLSGKMKVEGTSTSMSFDNSDDGFRRFETGFQVGGGYRFKIKKKIVLLDIRYSNGLTSVSRSKEMYNRYVNVSLQFISPWKKNPLAINRNSNG